MLTGGGGGSAHLSFDHIDYTDAIALTPSNCLTFNLCMLTMCKKISRSDNYKRVQSVVSQKYFCQNFNILRFLADDTPKTLRRSAKSIFCDFTKIKQKKSKKLEKIQN